MHRSEPWKCRTAVDIATYRMSDSLGVRTQNAMALTWVTPIRPKYRLHKIAIQVQKTKFQMVKYLNDKGFLRKGLPNDIILYTISKSNDFDDRSNLQYLAISALVVSA